MSKFYDNELFRLWLFPKGQMASTVPFVSCLEKQFVKLGLAVLTAKLPRHDL